MQSPSPRNASPRVRRTIAVAVFLFSRTLTTHGKFSVSGDEPHYLMIAESLRTDGDFDLDNNYADDDGRLFGRAGLEIGLHARMSRTGHLLSVHDPGLPVLLLPVYVVAQQVARIPTDAVLQRFKMSRGLFAYSIVSVFLIAVTACGVMLLADAVLSLTDSHAGPFIVAAAAISPPIVSYTFLVFPETVARVVTMIVVWYALATPRRETGTALVWLLLALGLLPWVHRKYSFYVLGLLFVLMWKRWPVFRRWSPLARVFGIASFVLPQIAFHAWTWYEWGTLGGPQMIERLPFSASSLETDW